MKKSCVKKKIIFLFLLIFTFFLINTVSSAYIGGGYCAETVCDEGETEEDGNCHCGSGSESTWTVWGVGTDSEYEDCTEGTRTEEKDGKTGLIGYLCEGNKEDQNTDNDIIGGGYCAETVCEEDGNCHCGSGSESTWTVWGVGTDSEYEDCTEGIKTDVKTGEGTDEPVGFLCREEECEPETCESLGVECGTHDDGCDGTINCGSCSSGKTCDDGSCVEDCEPETCESLGVECGTHDDGCDGTINCGSCSSGKTCDDDGQCCEPETCESLGVECGTHDDGCDGTINCGSCSSGKTCDDDGQCCEPETCESLGVECGTHDDGCGGTLDCECSGEYGLCDEQTHMCVSPVAHWESEGGNYLSEISILPDSTSVNAVVEDLVTFSEGDSIRFEIYEYDSAEGDDHIVTKESNVDSDSKARVTWDITQQNIEDADDHLLESEDDLEFYFKAYNSEEEEIIPKIYLDVKEVKDSDYCEINEISFCNSYDTKSDCEQDLCNVANESVENNNPDTTCGETYTDSDNCDYYTNCLCEWDNENEKCQPTSTDEVIDCPDDIDLPEDLSPSDLGVTCVQDEVIDDDCSDGFLTYSWEGYAEWSEENSFNSIPSGFEEKDFVQDEEDSYHYDPDKKSEDCKLSEEETVRCSSQLELFFFEYYQFLICLLLVVFVYFLLNNKKRIKCNQK